MTTPPYGHDRWATWFPRAVQSLGAAGGAHEIFISNSERPALLIFIAALIVGMEGVRALVTRRPTDDA